MQRHIDELRSAFSPKLSQEKLAKRLRVGRIAVLRWEKGQKPSVEALIRMGEISLDQKPELAHWFFAQAGINDSVIKKLSPAIEKSFEQFERRQEEEATRSHALPIAIIDPGTIVGPSVSPLGDSLERFKVPRRWFENPGNVFCVKGPSHERGTDLVFIDGSQRDKSELWGALVLVYFAKREDRPSYEIGGTSQWPERRILGRLHRSVSHGVNYEAPTLVPDTELYESLADDVDTVPPSNRLQIAAQHLMIPIDEEAGDAIIGRVVLRVYDPSRPPDTSLRWRESSKEKVSPRASVKPGRSRDRD
ncbi:MAG TPA: helix-turn-helix transcriptional regulator [Terriglobales bacterium]|nr:helix-turn-helix transcriptional regulator [Terriglobales bacterium]